ncbi:hypothetical protein K438DRAFT_1788273 [Mycena galopus ATCC 62051]|nr:hypothetical protein K438DRAFT_1788273 [Mycena galopus ATCC 62051]
MQLRPQVTGKCAPAAFRCAGGGGARNLLKAGWKWYMSAVEKLELETRNGGDRGLSVVIAPNKWEEQSIGISAVTKPLLLQHNSTSAQDVAQRQAQAEKPSSRADITGNHIDTPITTYVDRVSEDQRHRYLEEVLVAPPSPVKHQRMQETNPAIPRYEIRDNAETFDTLDQYQMGIDSDTIDEEITPDSVP